MCSSGVKQNKLYFTLVKKSLTDNFRKLDQKLSEAETFDLIKTAIDCVFPLPPNGVNPKKGKEETYQESVETEGLMRATFDALYTMLREILNKDPSPAGLESVFKVRLV